MHACLYLFSIWNAFYNVYDCRILINRITTGAVVEENCFEFESDQNLAVLIYLACTLMHYNLQFTFSKTFFNLLCLSARTFLFFSSPFSSVQLLVLLLYYYSWFLLYSIDLFCTSSISERCIFHEDKVGLYIFPSSKIRARFLATFQKLSNKNLMFAFHFGITERGNG